MVFLQVMNKCGRYFTLPAVVGLAAVVEIVPCAVVEASAVAVVSSSAAEAVIILNDCLNSCKNKVNFRFW